eukprot:jgi/Psemu1/291192/fgenesh1_pg.646_\
MKPCRFGDANANIPNFVMMLLVLGARQALKGVRSFSFRHHHHQKGMFARQSATGTLFGPNDPAVAAANRNAAAATDSSTTRLFYTPTAWPENLYQEWTLEQDQLLWSNFQDKKKSPSELAVLLGRGVRGVERRIEKLRDVNSSAYQRLFVNGKNNNDEDGGIIDRSDSKPKKLVPSSEVLRRIEWDYQLDEHDFFVLHYDRVDQTIVTSPLTAPNEGISSGETSLVKALPEHRIVAIAYKERVVWDRRNNRKHDLFFGPPGILEIVDGYWDWKENRDRQLREQKVLRQAWEERWVALLGSEARRDELVRWTEDILGETNTNDKYSPNASSHNHANPSFDNDDSSDTLVLTKDQQQRVDSYLHTTYELFRQLSEEIRDDSQASDKNALLVPLLNELSEWIASSCWSSLGNESFDDDEPSEASVFREMVLRKLSSTMDKLEGKTATTKAAPNSGTTKKERAKRENQRNQSLKLLLREEDLEETFVRGSGAGGQKINKTSNRVVLVHVPTGVRIECQDTRSLTQNRKIGRKRLLEKLDAHFHGTDSKQERKQQKVSQKKKKSKAKNKSRLAAKQERKKQEKLNRLREQDEADGDLDGIW